MRDTVATLEASCEGLYTALVRLQLESAHECAHETPTKRGEDGHGALSLEGAITDPLEGAVILHHYATSHFALAALLRHSRTGEAEAAERGLRALRFVARCAHSGFSRHPAYHWEFNNLAFAEALRCLPSAVSRQEVLAFRNVARGFRQSGSLATNWFAMRSLYSALSTAWSSKLWHTARSLVHLVPVLLAIKPDGCIDDFIGRSRPIQYSVYTAALLERHPLVPARLRRRIVLNTAEYVQRAMLPTGQFNCIGRGHEQIFGYGAAVYLLAACLGYVLPAQPARAASVHTSLDSMLSHLTRHQSQDGLFPLILNGQAQFPRWGYYDYHYVSVYNAFLLAWLELSLNKLQAHPDTRTNHGSLDGKTASSSVDVWFSCSSGTIAASTSHYKCLLSVGGSRYLADAGVTPHALWFARFGVIFACPGGPTERRHGRRHRYGDVYSNFLAPIFRARGSAHWQGPALGKPLSCRQLGGNQVVLAYRNSYLTIRRRVEFGPAFIQFVDSVVFNCTIEGELRLFNLPISQDLAWAADSMFVRIGHPRQTASIRIEFSSRTGPVAQAGELTENPLWACQALHVTHPANHFVAGQVLSIAWRIRSDG